MTNTPAPLDPIAQLVAKYQSNGHQTVPTQQQSGPQIRHIGWTGFAGKTFWDWLNLLGVLLVPLILGAGTILITVQQSAISQSQRDSDQRIADNQFQEALLKTFRDDINRLVLDEHLLTAKQNDPVQVMAQSYTNDALRKLDLPRRVLLVQFLSDLHLIISTTEDPALISLSEIDLRGAILRGAILSGADLGLADLSGADLGLADLHKANLHEADLRGADLGLADLRWADLHKANLRGADLRWADLHKANLRGADLSGANLSWAILYLADLRGADLDNADLSGDHLYGCFWQC